MVGRELELSRIARLLDTLASGPRGLLLEGDAGIGKTALLRSATRGAAERGMTVLSTAPAEPDMTLAFAGLADLLDAAGAQTLVALAPAHRAALDRALEQGAAEAV